MSVTVMLTHLQRSVLLRTLITFWQLFPISPQLTQLYLFEDNAAVIQMIMKGRSPSRRHGTRTHGVDLDRLFERTNLHHSVVFVKMRTNGQLADFVHQGSFSSQHWKKQRLLFEIHTYVHSEAVSQRQYLQRCLIHGARKPRYSHDSGSGNGRCFFARRAGISEISRFCPNLKISESENLTLF